MYLFEIPKLTQNNSIFIFCIITWLKINKNQLKYFIISEFFPIKNCIVQGLLYNLLLMKIMLKSEIYRG